MSSSRQTLSVQVPAQPRRYEIEIGPGMLAILPNWLSSQTPKPKKIAVISDLHTGPLYAEPVTEALINAGFDVSHYNIAGGEISKSIKSAQDIYELLASARFSRNDFLVAVGGGIVGDLVGFCAATYQRGMRWVQVPTTLLAQVDSSVGGKVAVNFGGLKNMVGVFYQPDLVIADLETLATLPERDYRASLGEVVKYALLENTASLDGTLSSPSLFESLSNNVDAIAQRDTQVLSEIVSRCCAIKASVVEADETDTTGHRAILNLGHTFGHAYESASEYGILHGEGVAIGMRKACELAVALGDIPSETADAVLILMQRLKLVYEPMNLYSETGFRPDVLLNWMRQDKKNSTDNITLVLPHESIGTVHIRKDVPDEKILTVFQS